MSAVKALSKRSKTDPVRTGAGRPKGTVRLRKEIIRKALKSSGGFVSYAANKLKCHPTTIRRAMERWPELKNELHEIREAHLDMAEHSLIKQVKEKNTAATIFMLKCLGKGRGYVEQPQQHQHLHAHAGAGSWADIIDRQITEGKIDRHTGQIVDAEIVENGKK